MTLLEILMMIPSGSQPGFLQNIILIFRSFQRFTRRFFLDFSLGNFLRIPPALFSKTPPDFFNNISSKNSFDNSSTSESGDPIWSFYRYYSGDVFDKSSDLISFSKNVSYYAITNFLKCSPEIPLGIIISSKLVFDVIYYDCFIWTLVWTLVWRFHKIL